MDSNSLPPKLPPGTTMDSPYAHYPLTRANMKHNLEAIIRQLLSYDLTQQQQYEALCARLYTPNAVFQYPIAKLAGRQAVLQFWNVFLLLRAVRGMDVYSTNVDVTWDADKLQALVQIEYYFSSRTFGWVADLIKLPFGKAWSCQVFQFEDFPSDGPGSLRVSFQEELANQGVYLGLFPVGVYTLRTDAGTPLNWLLNTARSAVGMTMAVTTPYLVQLLQATGVIKVAAA